MRVLDAFRPRGATWSGQVISSPPGPSGGPSKTHLLPGGGVPRGSQSSEPRPSPASPFRHSSVSASIRSCGCGRLPTASPPQCVVARGAGAAGPVLLACRQWDPLGLARRLPSLGVGAWRRAPLLPWRVQCPVCVCAALAAGSGGVRAGTWCCVSLVSPFPPRVFRAACGGPSPPGVPYPRSLVRHSMRSVRSARSGPVALPVVPACPFRVCALALTRCPLPPPPGWCGARISRGPGTGRW